MKKPPLPSSEEVPNAEAPRAAVPPPEPKEGAPLGRPAAYRGDGGSHGARGEKNDGGFQPGDSCGDYDILGVLASGGMGVVYKAAGRFGGKIVALKCVKPEHAERADLLERFETEIRILAQLKHRYIVNLLHAGKHQGNPYLVMEWLEGVTLRDFMNHRRQPIDLATALLYAGRIAEALVAAHAVGVLHRDLKPENVFMVNQGRLKLLDFGLGKLTEGNRVSTSERLGMMCTPHYAAPEQLERTGVDDRTDVYAAALIFVELVTGVYPYSDAPGVLPPRDVAQANQLLASPNSLRVLLPACSSSLTDLIDAALSKDKTKRPTSKEYLTGLRAARSALGKETAVTLPALEDEDSVDEDGVDEDSVDEAAPPAPPVDSESQDESSVVRRLPQIMTDVLPEDYQPKDPSSTANPWPRPRNTEKLPFPAAPRRPSEQNSDDGSAATQNAWMVPASGAEITSGGRSATLPPEPVEVAGRPAEPAERAEVAPAPTEPLAPPSAMPSPSSLAPRGDESAAARASMEFASRPTVPRVPLRGNGSASLTPAPTHSGVPILRAPPLWTAPALGVAGTLVVFAVVLLVRSRHHDGDRPASNFSEAASTSGAEAWPASTTLPEPVTPSGVMAAAASTETPQTPTATGSPVQPEPPSAAPTASVKPAPAVAQSTPVAASPTVRAPVPAPRGTLARAPFPARANAPAPTAPAAAPPPEAPPAAAPPAAAPHRLFGSEP